MRSIGRVGVLTACVAVLAAAPAAAQLPIPTPTPPIPVPTVPAPTLCEDERTYRFRGRCEPIEVIERVNRRQPSPADDTPAGSETLRAERTKLGLVAGRAVVDGKKVLLTKLRSTYFHEIDSAVGFMEFNDPAKIRSAADFQRAADKIGYTFNWFYVDSTQIGYYNSGANPVRAPRVDHDFPVWGTPRFEWRSWNPDAHTMAVTPFAQHPQVIDQRYLISWNNKQARGYRGSDSNTFSSAYRSLLLEDRLKPLISGPRKTNQAELVNAMEVAGTADLRAHVDLPLALRVRRPARSRSAGGGRQAARLAARGRAAQGREQGRRLRARRGDPPDGRVVAALGRRAVQARARGQGVRCADHGDRARQRAQHPRRPPRLRVPDGLVRLRAQGPPHRARAQGARVLRPPLLRRRGAAALPPGARALAARRDQAAREDIYGGDEVCRDLERSGDQWCFDAVRFRPVGGATQPLIHWINRPTYQQVVEVQGAAPR
jgi:hypothetical protein